MTNAELQDLVAFQNWARERALPGLEPLAPEEWTRPLGGSFAHLQATVAHIVWAQELWTERLRSGGSRSVAAPEEGEDCAGLRSRWRAAGQGLEAWLRAQPEDAGQRVFRYRRRGQEIASLVATAMLQLSHHHAYHLGQVAHMLRQLGHVPADTGYIAYRREAAQPPLF